jgi:acyl-CoA thioesterase FadM
MTMRLRTALTLLQGRSRPRIDVHDVATLPMRVWPSDTDVLEHMNNGVYLSIMDLGRYDLLVRSGLWSTLKGHRVYPVVTSETISFRKSLLPRQRYLLSTRIVGYDAISVYVEQRFTVQDEIFAVGFVRGRMLRRGAGALPMSELATLTGIDITDRTPPAWLTQWADTVALPSTRTPHRSQW